MGDYDLDTNMNTLNVQFCNGKDIRIYNRMRLAGKFLLTHVLAGF